MSKEICMTNEQREIHRKKRVIEHADGFESGDTFAWSSIVP